MDIYQLYDIAEPYMKLINPTSPEKIIRLGEVLGLNEGSRVIEFGCGFGEPLALWAENFGISGTGLEIREYCCERARKRLSDIGFGDRIEIVCCDAAGYEFEKHSFDVAAAIGTSFIWKGYQPAIIAMKEAILPGGNLVIGEPFWRSRREHIPPDVLEKEKEVEHTEADLLRIAREERFDFSYMVRSSQDDWDNYEACHWRGLVDWLEENPGHPERWEVRDFLYKMQDDYLGYAREHLGWALYVLNRNP